MVISGREEVDDDYDDKEMELGKEPIIRITEGLFFLDVCIMYVGLSINM